MMETNRKVSGFSLVEAVVAVGIFAVAMVAVIGLLAPTTAAIADIRGGDDATRVIPVIQERLQALARNGDFGPISSYFAPSSPPTASDYKLFISRDGGQFGEMGATIWNDPNDPSQVNGRKYFELALVRNTTLSPNLTGGYLAFTLLIRWPGYLPNGQKVADSQKSVLMVPMAITR